MADDKVEVLNNWPALMLEAKRRTRPSGKQRVTLEVKSEALGINTDERAIAMQVAHAFAEDIKALIRNGSSFATLTTQRFRQRARKAYDDGAAWAKKRYAGGKIGAMPPDQTKRDLLDSGRLVKGIVAMLTRDVGTAVVNVPANRLNEPDVYAKTMAKLKPYIEAAMKGEGVQKAGVQMAKDLIKKGQLSARDQRRELVQKLGETIGKFRELSGAVEDLSDE